MLKALFKIAAFEKVKPCTGLKNLVHSYFDNPPYSIIRKQVCIGYDVS
jgi:hypothetical protein